jgi:hypothetical protein
MFFPALKNPFRAALLLVLITLLIVPMVRAQDENIVSRVNDEPITADMFQARVRFVRWQYLKELDKLYEATGGNPALSEDYALSLLDTLEDPAQLGQDVLDLLEEERLLWQTAAELNLSATTDDAEAIGADFFSAWTEIPADELAQNPGAQEFIAAWYTEAVEVSGMSQKDIRAIFATEALRRVLYDYVGVNVPTEELAVHSWHILCAFDDSPTERATAEACIQAAQTRLTAGETVEAVISGLSADMPTISGGDLGWVLHSYLPQAYADAVRDAPLDTVIGPVETEYGLHLINVVERRMQELSPAELESSKQGYFQLWLDTLWTKTDVVRSPGWEENIPDDPGLDTLRPEVREKLEALKQKEG